ncbi:MAG: hypothetical protein IIZ27_09820 [Solobacterium sp.]|nr:hypothetical protein [Solobacterium sp.]
MKKILKLVFVVFVFIMYGCGTAEKKDTNVSKPEKTPKTETKETQQKNETFVLNASPDKYTQYVNKYIGMNAANVGYTSLGGDRLDEIGDAYLKIVFVTEDGSYVGQLDEDNLKNYVVINQNIKPNTEVKLEYEKYSDGKESSIVSFQTYETIDLAVKKVKDNVTIDLMEIMPSPDKYTHYIRNYVGKNLASVGYESLGGDYLDEYGEGTLELVIASDDGSYVDYTDEEILKQYVVIDQSIEPNSEMKYEYMKYSDGKESTIVDNQTYSSITLYVRTVTGEAPIVHKAENNTPEPTPTPTPEPTPTPTPTPEPTPAPTPEPTPTPEVKASGIRPEFKEMMDSYEAFIDEYIEFMETYESSQNQTGLMLQYMNYMGKLLEFQEKIDEVDESELTDEEAMYYAQVSLRCSEKLIKASQ